LTHLLVPVILACTWT